MSTPPSSGHLQATHYDNYLKMFYLDVSLLHSMQHLPNSYLWQMKVMRVVPTLTYQHLYEKHHAYTTVPAWNMHPSTQCTLHPTAQLTHHTTTHKYPHPDQCTTTSHLFLTVQRATRMQTAHRTAHQMKKKISKQYL